MWWPEKVGVDVCIGFICVVTICFDGVLETADVVECVVAHPMAVLDYLTILFRILPYVVANHEERSLDVVFLECLQNERGRFGYRTIIEGQIHRMILFVHSPCGTRVEPSEPHCRLFYNHIFRLLLWVFTANVVVVCVILLNLQSVLLVPWQAGILCFAEHGHHHLEVQLAVIHAL